MFWHKQDDQEAKWVRERIENEIPLSTFIASKKQESLRECCEHTAKGGLVGVISSRYCYYGGGYSFARLPEEKLEFLDLYLRLTKLGAQRFYLFGMSWKALEQIVYPKQGEVLVALSRMQKIGHLLGDPQLRNPYLPSLPPFKYLDSAQVEKIIQNTALVPALNQVARIDALFAEMPGRTLP